jgi:hypothetical protein
VGGKNALDEERELHLIECHRFAAMRRVEERSLSSILRSNLLTTLMNNDVSGKVNASGCVSALDKFDAMQICLTSGSAENKALCEERC